MDKDQGFKYEKLSNDTYCYNVEGPNIIVNLPSTSYSLSTDTLKQYGNRFQFTQLIQCERIVIPGLILTKHIFQGLNRNLCCGDDMDGDSDKFVFCWKPAYDYRWLGDPSNDKVSKVLAPQNKVFSVIISKNSKKEFPSVTGWIERWVWIDEDPELPEAPIGWVDRYSKKVWSRENEF